MLTATVAETASRLSSSSCKTAPSPKHQTERMHQLHGTRSLVSLMLQKRYAPSQSTCQSDGACCTRYPKPKRKQLALLATGLSLADLHPQKIELSRRGHTNFWQASCSARSLSAVPNAHPYSFRLFGKSAEAPPTSCPPSFVW